MTDPDIDDFLGATPRHRVNHWLSLSLLVVAAVAAFVLLVRFYNGPDQRWYSEPIERADLTPVITVDGTLHGDGEITVRAAADGIVRSVAGPGDGAIPANAPLASFDISAARNDAAIATAGATAAQAQLDAAHSADNDARTRLARFEDVYRRSDGRVPALSEMDDARAAVARTEAAIATAAAALEAMRSDRKVAVARAADAVVRAPFAGFVTERLVVPSQPVRAGAPLVTLVPDPDRLVIHVAMSAAEATQITPGAKARVLVGGLPAAGRTATLARIDPGAPGAGEQRDVVYALDGAANPLRPGMAVRLEIPMPVRAQVLVVPNSALAVAPPGSTPRSSQGNAALYVLGDDHQPRVVAVSVGGTDGKRTEVQGVGLAAGMEVITGTRSKDDLPPGAVRAPENFRAPDMLKARVRAAPAKRDGTKQR